MRVSSIQIFQQGIEAFGRQQSKLSVLQQQISSGVKLTKPSDNPAASSRVLELQQTVSLLDQYNVNISLAENRLRLEETTLDAVENIYFRINELTIQASGIANDEGALDAIAIEIQERYNELLSLANTQDSAGDYLFAGFQNQDIPFEQVTTGSIQHVEYYGDQGQRSYQISPSRQIIADDSGSEIFLQIPSAVALNESTTSTNAQMAPAFVYDNDTYVADTYQIVFDPLIAGEYDIIDSVGNILVDNATYTDSTDIEFNGIRTSITGNPAPGDTFTISPGQYRDIFTTINSIITTLQDPSVTNDRLMANLAQAQLDLDVFSDKVLDVRTSIGGRLNALEAQFDDNNAFIITTQSTISSLRDTDLAEAISQLTLEQTTLDAAQATFARISSSSLFNFLR